MTKIDARNWMNQHLRFNLVQYGDQKQFVNFAKNLKIIGIDNEIIFTNNIHFIQDQETRSTGSMIC